MPAVSYREVWPVLAKQWDGMKINPSRWQEFAQVAKGRINYKGRYQEIEAATKVPWALIAVLHVRESSGNFGTYLGNGQSLNHRTTIVPKNRGPFKSFFDGAVDALRIDGLSGITQWPIEKQLYFATSFNGWGYWLYHNHMPSPYIWGGTNEQVRGKYGPRDGQWSAGLWDPQEGCAPLLWMIQHLDNSFSFSRET